MAEFAKPGQWSWKLCTRTESEDYFWIDDHMQPTRKSDLYGCVADESNQRTGYFLSTKEWIEIGISNLDAQRKDRFGREIIHSLLLRSPRKDEERTELLRKMFAEAICDISEDPAAAVLARELYALWESRDGSDPGAIWPSPAVTPVLPDGLPSPNCISPGWQYARTPDTLRQFAAAALFRDRDILLLCAATNPVDRIWSIVLHQNIATAVCAVTVKQDSEYTRLSYSHGEGTTFSHQTTPKDIARNLANGADKAADFLKRIGNKRLWGIIFIMVLLSVLAFWWHRHSGRVTEADSGVTALQVNDLPGEDAPNTQSRETAEELSQGAQP